MRVAVEMIVAMATDVRCENAVWRIKGKRVVIPDEEDSWQESCE